ncbi:hypothetical protein LHYA1_G003509 [Lachnellula hyalina]|uniref:Uncharacterized protein n=1 Tax=Lachnellula hyalina TaxID=1316788 RepID=A0A8H8TZL8_9HELO|nr:uncharacterized protein LHYA1_G003509 [Lachnellula hyalina]TVY27942.1 hypothetical protein LHYA1_G003509 [Lachnellula hyalina]
MSTPPVQVQWSLNDTSQSVFSVLRGVMAAATSENVQVLALLSCERFGNTIAMSNETNSKVVYTLVPTPDPAPVRFLKGLVGFSTGDCATQLSNSLAGIRFLGLTAAIVTTVGSFNSAKALDIMLRSSATDLTLLPTVRQLNDLLGSLETRCYRCGFTDSVVGWQIILQREILPSISSEAVRKNLTENALLVPSPETIADLVGAFRQVARMGSSTVIGATIKVRESAPWILAFAQWCLDVPPSVYMDGIAGAVLEQPQSRIRFIVSNDLSKPLELVVHHQLEDITKLLGPASRHPMSGMVTVDTYYPWLFQQLGFTGDTMFRLLRQTLEHAIPQVLSAMRCGRFTRLGQTTTSEHLLGSIDNSVNTCYLSPLPNMNIIAQVYAKALALDGPVHFITLQQGMLIADLPLVSRHLESLMEKCYCEECCESTQRYAEPVSNKGFCYKKSFFRSIGFIIAEIFVLSLFESSTPVLVRLSLDRQQGLPALDNNFAQVIKSGNSQKFDDMDLIDWARSMVGHVFDDEAPGLLLTSGKGQVIYPVVLDTFYVEKQGYLKLYCLPGLLRYQNEIYSVVSSVDGENAEYPHSNLPAYPKVFRPLNLFKEFMLSWKISIKENKELCIKLMMCSSSDTSFRVETDPLLILLYLRDTLLLERCPHNLQAQLTDADRFSSYTSPWYQDEEASDAASQVSVVPVDGADDLRCFAIACQGSSVMRRNSCLQCSLNLCRNADVHSLIL